MSVVDWLLDSDPSIRWQVMRDLTNEPGLTHLRGHTTSPSRESIRVS
jgi:hypothetical protein